MNLFAKVSIFCNIASCRQAARKERGASRWRATALYRADAWRSIGATEPVPVSA